MAPSKSLKPFCKIYILRNLTLRELRCTTCLVQTSLLAFHNASVAGQEASLLQSNTVCIAIDGIQCTSNTQANSASLAGGAAAVNEDYDVELTFKLEQHDW